MTSEQLEPTVGHGFHPDSALVRRSVDLQKHTWGDLATALLNDGGSELALKTGIINAVDRAPSRQKVHQNEFLSIPEHHHYQLLPLTLWSWTFGVMVIPGASIASLRTGSQDRSGRPMALPLVTSLARKSSRFA